MMKKVLFIMLCVAALALTGCGQRETPDTAINTPATPAPVFSGATEAPVPESSTAEIDLTSMSATMVYSYVFNLFNTPDAFIGQRFKMQGIYDEWRWEQADQTYHYIIVADATACCAQGLEFVLTDESAAYPQPGDEIEIIGVFGTYEENGNLYVRITSDQITRL